MSPEQFLSSSVWRTRMKTYFKLMDTVDPQGKLSKFKLGFDVTKGHVPQLLVQKNCWKTAILEEGEFGLLGEAVAPGFEYQDMEMAKPDSFRATFPNLWDELSPYIKQ